MKHLITALMFVLMTTQANANNVIPVQEELREDQIEWLNKHRADETFGNHASFIWLRDPSGYMWSVSIGEYRRSSFAEAEDLKGFLNAQINSRLDAEREHLDSQLEKASAMVLELAKAGMTLPQATIIARNTFEGFAIHKGGVAMISSKYPNLIITK